MAKLCQPERVFWCNGSEAEKQLLTREAVEKGILIELNQEKLPGCYYHRSNPNDVARVEQCTFICTDSKEEAGPTNNWAPPREMYEKLYGMFRGSMRGRTLYVIPYLMGPAGSPMSKVGIELSDSSYVVLNMRIMRGWAMLLTSNSVKQRFQPRLHSMLDVNPDRRYICHFPQDNTILSIGSAYGGNVLLARSAWPCGSVRIWGAMKGGWPNIC